MYTKVWDTYTDPGQWEEGVFGAIIGGLGSPNITLSRGQGFMQGGA